MDEAKRRRPLSPKIMKLSGKGAADAVSLWRGRAVMRPDVGQAASGNYPI